ncbi:BrnT family toxin [Acidithiobacillus sp. MC6.1]|nr:BrnT family toxin [Acidithiobacillus sp. MC6.1]
MTFDEAKTCFHDPWQVAFHDPGHSEEEDRELLIGHSNQGRLLLVSYTLREDLVRIISARKAATSEENQYTQGI